VEDAAGPRPSRVPLVAFSLLAVLGLAAAGLGIHLRTGRVEAPPILGAVPAFSLTERSGRTVARADLDGQTWVADFIFTRCGGICPLMTARMKDVHADAPGVTLVSFSVDPEHDTPAVLRDYAARHGIGEGWLFLTGDQAVLHALARDGFKLAAAAVPAEEQQQGGDGPFLHSSRLVLVDGRARIRGYYDSNEAQALARLRQDLRALAAGS
jgi:cytochrome oxidase Cu insertion factor (SCO1/SenC/PrrC family)